MFFRGLCPMALIGMAGSRHCNACLWTTTLECGMYKFMHNMLIY